MNTKSLTPASAPTTASGALRVRPRIWIGLAVFAGYDILVSAVQHASGIAYPDLGVSGLNLFLGAGVSLIVAALFLAVTATCLGWWRPALFEQRHSVRWPIFIPALMAAALLINLVSVDWASYDLGFFAASIVLLLVGFVEEMATRGLLIVGLRSRLSEGWVWFFSSAVFALMHLENALSGQNLTSTIQQVFFAFLAGTVLYILRRTTGSLIWAMVLHGLWDFSVFALGHGAAGPFAGFGVMLNTLAGVLALICVAFVIRGAKESTAQNKVVASKVSLAA
ncbi:CPBP family intramembrane glutamic endopeptidase [Glutamicibacter sp.]|uniref:CPBP family intramembrane glutamic endopeptidase n=1 Tax=Glutamicibacter sp. TaxID=1931995 RepID=UPI0028BD4FBB|nr:CPBP family intramembrane glutamic endopeptidase [Glutamicibacter sp.]